MPKKVDHRQRRTLIADALMRVAAERGIEAVSLRHVAAEAGVTSGMVQHYFRSKDEMMTFAMEVVRERVAARLGADSAGEPDGLGGPDAGELDAGRPDAGRPDTGAPIAELVRDLFVQLLPLDEERRIEGRVALAFMAYAAGHPEVGTAVRADNALLRAAVAEQLRAAQDAGQVRTDLDAEHAATALLALVEGLGMQTLSGDYSPETALAVFDAQIAVLFGPNG